MPKKIGERRSVPDKLIDSWTYKVKDVEIERLEYVEAGEGERDPDTRKDTRTFDEKYKRSKERITNKHVTVNVYMLKKTHQSEEPPHPLDSVEMRVHCPELKIEITGTDIAAMKAAMWSMLDEKFEIEWERYYQVQVLKPYIFGGDGDGVEIVYDDVYKGTTFDGKLLLRRWRGHEFKIEPWPGAFKDEKGKIMACILATEENKAALEEFCARMVTLRKMLADFLRPDVIQQNLMRLAGCALLPPVSTELVEADE